MFKSCPRNQYTSPITPFIVIVYGHCRKTAHLVQPVEKETHWVEIQLLGEDGQPIPQEEFLVELPDGKRETGFLDGQGLARFSGLLTSGTCKVSFPQLDRDAWQLIATEPKMAASG